MKIAVTYENGQIFQHFGHTEQFKVYNVENGAVTSSAVEPTNGSGHGALAGFLVGLGVDTLICGGIGGGAIAALNEAGITLYAGVAGDADAAVEALLAGNLARNVEPTNGSGHGALAGFLVGLGVDTLICGGIGGGAIAALNEAGITLYAGVAGDADAAVEALLAGNLARNVEPTCHHHDHGHHECHGHDHGHGHTCGGHCGG